MQIRDILSEQRVSLALTATDKEGVLRELADLFRTTDAGLDVEDIYRVLADRERLASTGVGSGVAIPHGRVAGLRELQAVLAIHAAGVSFDSVDGEPARIFVAILAPERQTSDHLKALARISRILRNPEVREALLRAESPAAALDLVTRND